MRAAQYTSYGALENVQIVDMPKPSIGLGQILVEVKAAGVNPIDWKCVMGFGDFFGHQLPQQLGVEVAGIVSNVSSDVTRFKVGDKVHASIPGSRMGGLAEYTLLYADEAAKMAPDLNFETAAALALGTSTAWQAMIEIGELQSGERVLIHAAAGGVGSLAVQIATALGCESVGTGSAHNLDYIKSLGATDAFDYAAARFEEKLDDFDLVLGTFGGDTLERSGKVLKPGGRLVSVSDPIPEGMSERYGIHTNFAMVRSDGKQLQHLMTGVNGYRLRATVAETIGLDGIVDALKQSRNGHVRGRIVVIF